MTDSEIIWKYLTREYPDSHQIVYLYTLDTFNSGKSSINSIFEATKKLFSPPIEEILLNNIIKGFLEYKKKQYKNGEIRLTSIYN